MRSAVFFTAAFAAAVMASPLEVRDEVIVTATDISYVTDIVTVTAGQEPAATTPAAVQPAAATSTSAYGGWFRKHRHSKKPRPSSSAPAPAPAPSSTSFAGYPTVAPSPSSAPAPAPSSSEAPAPAPAPSSYSAPAPAPTTSAAPAPSSAPSATGGTSMPAEPPASASGAKYPKASGASQVAVDTAAVVGHHNVHRANYSSPDLEWDSDLFNSAAIVASSCVFAHQMDVTGGGYGQNIAASGGSGAPSMGSVITDQFYNSEVDKYVSAIGGVYGNEPDMSTAVFEGYGHMSQVVWAGSTKAACAQAYCPNGMQTVNTDGSLSHADYQYYTVCNYSPAGNMVGDFAKNIGNCKDQPTVDGAANLG